MPHSAVVRVYATRQEYDFDSPWQAESPSGSTGSGVVVGDGRILTGAHVIADSTFLQVQKSADPDKYIAEIEGVCHDADLALLRVEDARFMEGVEPAELGELPEPGSPVSVLGYPVGGEQISVTEGVVSRIEVQQYKHSQRELLAVTVDAAINDGNSGGPVLQDDRVVGIAFQSLQDADGIGEMVPTPIIERFFEGIEHGKPLEVPGLGVTFQTLENPALRQSLSMKKKQSGVLVTSVDYLGSAQGRLEVGDVILAIDGLEIANNGTILYRDLFRTSLSVVLSERFVGDELRLVILRDGEQRDVSLTLAHHGWLVPRTLYDRSPSWFVYCGLVFQPLSRDLLRTWDDWWDNAPCEFLQLYYWGGRTETQREVIVLTQVLNDEINVGYEDRYNETIVEVNGQRPVDLEAFVRIVDGCEGRLQMKTAFGNVIVFDTTSVGPACARILDRYHVRGDRSDDLAR